MVFRDRTQAGQLLAAELASRGETPKVVAGLARGGMVVAAPVAAALGAWLDVIVVRKLGAPGRPELGIGAVAEGGVRVLNEELVQAVGAGPSYIEQVTADETRELVRRIELYRGARPPIPVDGATVVLVDDGLATGYTARAAAESVAARGAGRVLLAVPVGAPQTVEALAGVVAGVVCLHTPEEMLSVGAAYEDFTQVSDEQVAALLDLNAR